MKNIQQCPNCGTENPIYKYSCTNCKAFLRERIVNIDLWKTIYSILESPILTFTKIIEAEHKNFVIFLNTLIGIKFFLITVILKSFNQINSFDNDYFLQNLLIIVGVSFILLMLLAFIFTKLNNVFGLENRFRDNYSIIVYSFIPLLFSLVLLSPVHYALFGQYWFTYNPPPYVIKEVPAYILLFIEGLLTIWSALLVIFGFYSQTKNKVYAIITGVFSIALIVLVLYNFPFLPL